MKIILGLLIFGLIFILSDIFFSQTEYYTGKVIDKHYSASSTRTGTGIGVTSFGKTGVVTTYETEPEKFILMVKTPKGNVLTAECKPELFYEKQINNSIEFAIDKGCFTGIDWSVYGVK